MKFLQKIPAGMMIVPLFLSALINTFFPDLLQIGSFTTAIFTGVGVAPIIGVQLVCMGAQLRFQSLGKVLLRGGVLLLAKFAIGAAIGIAIGSIFGMAGVLGLTTLAVISAITNSNGSMYLALMSTYGDEVDQTSMSLLAVNDGPFFTLVALGASGLANVPTLSLVAVVIPIIFGMILGNLDKSMSEFLKPGVGLMLPFVGFTLGAGINLTNIVAGGMSGILLGILTVAVSGPFVVLADRFISKRPGYAGWAVSTTAGNAIAVPAAVAIIDPAWAPYVSEATTQVAASVVFTAIAIPLITTWWAKKYGCPKMPLFEGQFDNNSKNKEGAVNA